MKKRILVFIMVALALCCNVIAMPENFGVVVHAEGESNKELVKATIGDHLEDDLVYTYRSSEGTYAFSEPDGDYADQVMYDCGSARTNMMPVGNDIEGFGDVLTDRGTYYSVMKFQLDENITNLNWDYACLDLTPVYGKVGYNDGFILEAYLVDDYDMNTLTYNSFPQQIEGSPMVEINPGRGNVFKATRCDVTELIKWAVEKGMTNINIKFVRSDKSPSEEDCVFLCTERYTNPSYPDTDFTPTLRLLEADKKLVKATIGDHLKDDLVYTYRSSEGTYAFNPIDQGETKGADLVMNEVGTRTNMMPVGQGYGPCQDDKINGMHYSIMKFQLDQNIKDIYWDYACLDLTPIYSTVGYNDGFILEAYLVDDYDMNTLTYNSFPQQIEGSPMVEINPGRGNAFEATRCDVTELINWAVENDMTNINIKFVRSSKSTPGKNLVCLSTERYTNPDYPNTDFTPTLRLLESEVPTKLKIKGGDRTLNPGDIRYLESNGFNAGEGVTPVFSSDNSNIVTVDNDGVLKAEAVGEATITLTMGDYNATIAVNVEEDPTSDDFKLMKERWLDYLLIDASEKYPDVTGEQIKMLSEKAQGLWETMNKEGTERSLLWNNYQETTRVSQKTWYQFQDLRTLASAFLTPGTTLYQNHDVARALLDSLEFMTATGEYEELDYNWTYNGDLIGMAGNWWDWQIGAAQEFIYTLLMMESYLEEEEIVRYTDIINKYAHDPCKQLAIDGSFVLAEPANLCNIAHSVHIQGLLRNDEALVKLITAPTSVPYAMVMKDDYATLGNGQYKDGSYIAHGTMAYTGGYGIEAIKGISLFGNILGGTDYDFDEETLEEYFNYAMEAYLPLLYKGKVMSMVTGRGLAQSHYGKGIELKTGIELMRYMLVLAQNADEYYKNIIQGVIKYNLEGMVEYYGDTSVFKDELSLLELLVDDSVQSMTYLEGIKIYGAMCRVVQATENYTAGLALTSNHISSYETISYTNYTGFYQGTGALYIYNSDLDQFGWQFWPTQDPYRLTGVTADTTPLVTELDKNGGLWPPPILGNKTAGGASDGKLASIAYQFCGDGYKLDTKARKSYFFLEDGIVCMGTDISGTTEHTIETTIEARMLNEDGSNRVLINGEVFDGAKKTIHLEAGSWIHMEGNCEGADMAYYFPVAIDIEIEKELCTGSYTKMSSTTVTDVHERWYLNIGINHGTGNVSGGQYLYVTLPGMSVDEIKDYAANNTLKIMDGTVEDGNALAHFIKNNNGTMMAVNYFGEESYKADWLTLNPGNGNISVLVTEDEGVYTLSIAEPSFSDATLSVATDYKMNVESKSDEITVADDGMSFTVDTTASGAHSFQIKFTLEGMPDDDEGDSGDTGSGSDEGDSSDAGSGSDEGESSDTGSGSDEGESSDTGSGSDEGEAGDTSSGSDEGESSDTESGSDAGNAGDTGSDSDEGDSGDMESDSDDGNPESTVSPTNTTVAETGDTSPMLSMIITMCLSGMCILALILYKKRKNDSITD